MGLCEDVHACVRIIKDHPFHWHDALTIVMVVEGSINLRVWARDNIMKPGDIIALNPGELHRLSAITVDNLVIILSFSWEFSLRACKNFVDSIIICNSVQYEKKNPYIYDELNSKLSDMINEYGKPSCLGKVQEKAESVLRHLCYNFDYISVGIDHKRFSNYVISRNKMLYRKIFLENSELTDMSLKALSEHLGINYTYLRTDILKRFGFGYSWLKYTIMTERAARIILCTDKRLIDISNQCGFSDQKYLRKYFKKFYECTPSEFRNKHKVPYCKNDSFVEIPIKYIMKFCEHFKRF